MSKREGIRVAAAKEALQNIGGFPLEEPDTLFSMREEVLEAIAPATRVGGRANELIERVQDAGRANKFAKAVRVLGSHLDRVSASRASASQVKSSRTGPRLAPHHHQMSHST